ncbi:MAG: TIGR03790 family protein [Fimbriimonadaceae bacterium]|nr:TIGR03790 family protein [Fimbriimonadaceae bacterium]
MKSTSVLLVAIGLLSNGACRTTAPIAEPGPQTRTTARPHPDAARVLVLINQRSPESVEIGTYYQKARGIPEANILRVDCPTDEQVHPDVVDNNLIPAIRKAVANKVPPIDFVVTTKGIPIRIGNPFGLSVDALLTADGLGMTAITEPVPDQIRRAANPYFNSEQRFSSTNMKFRLVTRLDGYTVADVKGLIDRAVAAKPEKGLFFFDMAENRASGGYEQHNNLLKAADELVRQRGFESQLDTQRPFIAPTEAMMGYVSWGSNDGAFSSELYQRLRFRPGAIAETFVSTSGRTFRTTSGGQSLIADLVRQGVTGVKGYVSEPYLFAMAVPPLLFDRYLAGWNLAESYYCASPVLKWKDVVIGDPLCAPYAKSASTEQSEQNGGTK